MFRPALVAIVVAIMAAGCTTRSVEMTYDRAGAQPVAAETAQSVALGTFSDHRGHGANWLGAIRGGFGNPLKTLETPQPVKDVVRDAYAEGLKARDMLSDDGDAPYILRVVVDQFDCNQYVRREAHIKFDVELWGRDIERSVYKRRIVVDNVDGNLVAFDVGILASIEDLRKVANDTLQQAVDETLDDPTIRAALAGERRTY